MHKSRGLVIRATAVVCLILGMALGACSLFEGTSLERQIERLQRDAADIVKKLKTEDDPRAKARLEKDLKKIQENLSEAMEKAAKELKKVDFEGMFEDIGEGIKSLGD